MEVIGEETRTVKVDISDREVQRIVFDKLFELFDWKAGYFIKDGGVYFEDKLDNVRVRDASSDDVEFASAFALICKKF